MPLVIKQTPTRFTLRNKIERVQKIKELIRKTEEVFSLPWKCMHLRHQKTGRPLRRYDGVSMTDIKIALIYFIRERMDTTDIELAEAFEMERTSILHLRGKGEHYFIHSDEVFFSFYEKICGGVEN